MDRARRVPLLCTIALIGLAGCGGGGEGAVPVSAAPEPLSLTFGPYPLEPGHELDFCEYFEIESDEPTYVTRIEQGNGGRTHHAFLYKTDLETPPGTGPCPDAAQKLLNSDGIYAATSLQGPSQMPEGVAIELAPRQRMFLNIHLINTSGAPTADTVTLNLTRGDPARGWTPVGFFEFTTFEIQIPPYAEGTAGNSCVFPRDVSLISITSHSHARTTLVTANLWDGEASGEEVYRNTSWSEPTVETFGEPLDVAGQTGLTFMCHYKNDDPFEVGFGETAADEMCYLLGHYYPGPETIICAL
jgi:hypothetical protein